MARYHISIMPSDVYAREGRYLHIIKSFVCEIPGNLFASFPIFNSFQRNRYYELSHKDVL